MGVSGIGLTVLAPATAARPATAEVVRPRQINEDFGEAARNGRLPGLGPHPDGVGRLVDKSV